MKAILLLMVCLVISSFILLPQKQSKAKIKSTTIYSYNVTENPVDTINWQLKIVTTYNKQGKVTGTTVYKPSNEIFMSSNTTYDSEGREILTTNYKGDTIANVNYSYDKQNNLITTKSVHNRIINTRISNKKALTDTVLEYDIKGDLMRKNLLYFDTNGDKTATTAFYANSKLNHKEATKYDNNHRLIDEIYFNADGSRDNHKTIAYDANKGYTQIDSNLIYIGGLPANKISEKVFSRTFRYDKLDKEGNWLKQSYLINNKFALLSKRTIEYY